MRELPSADIEKLLELSKYAFLRLDGAWFLASAEKYGVEQATELDVKAWDIFSERLAKRIVTELNLKGDFSEILPRVLGVHSALMNAKTELEFLGEDRAIFRVKDCEIWKMVSRVWTPETAPCHKVTQTSIRGMLRGAFPKDQFEIKQNKRIPLGDPCCEVEIIRKTSARSRTPS